MTYHIILLVIISNNISLSTLITLTYYLIFNGLFIQYTKPHLSIIRKWFSFIALLKSASTCCFTTVLLLIHQYFVC